MDALSRTPRLLATAIAAILTTVLFSAVVSLAEPQRSALTAQTSAKQALAAAKMPMRVAQAR
jgi:hypothetical protein